MMLELGSVCLFYKDGTKVSLTFHKITVKKCSICVEHEELGFFYAGVHEIERLEIEVFDNVENTFLGCSSGCR